MNNIEIKQTLDRPIWSRIQAELNTSVSMFNAGGGNSSAGALDTANQISPTNDFRVFGFRFALLPKGTGTETAGQRMKDLVAIINNSWWELEIQKQTRFAIPLHHLFSVPLITAITAGASMQSGIMLGVFNADYMLAQSQFIDLVKGQNFAARYRNDNASVSLTGAYDFSVMLKGIELQRELKAG